MSFDVVVLRPKLALASLLGIEADNVSALGSPEEIRARCQEVFSGVEWSGETQGLYHGPGGYALEFSIPSGATPSSLHLSLHFGLSWNDDSKTHFRTALDRLFVDFGWQSFAVSDNSAMSGHTDA
jgi:hypothetical protein